MFHAFGRTQGSRAKKISSSYGNARARQPGPAQPHVVPSGQTHESRVSVPESAVHVHSTGGTAPSKQVPLQHGALQQAPQHAGAHDESPVSPESVPESVVAHPPATHVSPSVVQSVVHVPQWYGSFIRSKQPVGQSVKPEPGHLQPPAQYAGLGGQTVVQEPQCEGSLKRL
jgi:hypothetical protein